MRRNGSARPSCARARVPRTTACRRADATRVGGRCAAYGARHRRGRHVHPTAVDSECAVKGETPSLTVKSGAAQAAQIGDFALTMGLRRLKTRAKTPVFAFTKTNALNRPRRRIRYEEDKTTMKESRPCVDARPPRPPPHARARANAARARRRRCSSARTPPRLRAARESRPPAFGRPARRRPSSRLVVSWPVSTTTGVSLRFGLGRDFAGRPRLCSC